MVATSILGQQPTFENVNLDLNFNATYSGISWYASGLSVRDFDQDGWDDISMCTDETDHPRVFKNYYGTFKEVDKGFAILRHGNYIAWIDYDNDGLLDCFGVNDTGGVYFMRQDSTGVLNDVSSQIGLGSLPHASREGALFSDFNNDGLLDLFISVYNFSHTNALFFQDSNNHFVDVSVSSGACDTVNHTFHAIAIDYNNDGWMDFYEANDFYDGNLFYKNNGDSTFTEVSGINGTYEELDAMGLGVGDFDGDLDLDIHVTNRFASSKLLRNNNDGTFTEVAQQHNLEYFNGFGWGNNFFDADLDGDNDLYVSGIIKPFVNGLPSHLYVNDGQANFTADTLYNDSLFSFANAIFDFNNDRLPDIVSLNSDGNPSSLWKNTTSTTNKRFSISLEGCSSNRDAIGSQIIAYDGTDKHLWMTHSTQAYCSQNSDKQIIPILNGATLDSLLIKWPSGGDTTLYNIEPDQTIRLSECGDARPHVVIKVLDYSDHELNLCPNDSITLFIDGAYDAVLWSNGSTSDTITVTSSGTYDVTVTNQFGITGPSTSPVSILSYDFAHYSSSIEAPLCFNNGSISLAPISSGSSYQYSWSTGATTDSITELTPGLYIVTVTNQDECGVVDSFELVGPDSLNPIQISFQYDPILCHDDSTIVTTSGSGGYGPFEYYWSGGDTGAIQELTAGIHSVTATDPNGCQKDTSFLITHPENLFVWAESTPDTNYSGVGKAWVEINGGTPPYSSIWDDSLAQTGDTAYGLISRKYNVIVEDANACPYNREVDVRNRTVIGINGSINNSEPECVAFNDYFILRDLKKPVNASQINVVDVTGRSIPFHSEALGQNQVKIMIQESGLYILEVDGAYACKILNP